jgi:hypothetical protein
MFEKVNTNGLSPSAIKKLADPNFKLQKSAEEKEYLIVFCADTEEPIGSSIVGEISSEAYSDRDVNEIGVPTIDGECIFVNGRKNAFNQIRDFIAADSEFNTIDYDKSFVIVEGVTLENRISLRKFINLCNETYKEED